MAAVVGSFAYNATMTLRASAIVRPLRITGADHLHVPVVVMIGALGLAIRLGWRTGHIPRAAACCWIACYPAFVILVFLPG